jgi:ubiquinone/menaquinone biosynthesis C-methylase UbiE
MDIGCSVGQSTKFLIEAFPEKDGVDAIDLSPYFLSNAMFHHRTLDSPIYTTLNKKILYHHMLAEDLSFPSNTYDIVSISYLLHEVPTKTAVAVIAEAFRVLRPGGVVSIVDLSGKKIKSLLQPQKAFFELTEPHILQYYKTDPMKILADTGFTFIETKRNDPMNALWIASKPEARNFRAESIQSKEVKKPTVPTAHDIRVKAATQIKGLLQNLLASIRCFFKLNPNKAK